MVARVCVTAVEPSSNETPYAPERVVSGIRPLTAPEMNRQRRLHDIRGVVLVKRGPQLPYSGVASGKDCRPTRGYVKSV